MATTDEYRTLLAPCSGEFKDRGSRFLGFALPVREEAELQDALQRLRKEHFKARHHCYALRLGLNQQLFRANDDGEPSGTAGRPILGQIDSFGLTNVGVIVVRYFGGTLLGASGLITAYRSAAAAALGAGTMVTKTVQDWYRLNFDYTQMGAVMTVLKKNGLTPMDPNYGEQASLMVGIRQSAVDEVWLQLKSAVGNISREEAASLAAVPGLTWEWLHTR